MSSDKIVVPEGFEFSTAAGRFKYQNRDDLGLIYSKQPAAAAGVFTRNKFRAAPVKIARELLKNQYMRAILVNSGQANACTGEKGLEVCNRTLEILGKQFDLPKEEILPASTGVIGEQMDLDLWYSAVKSLYRNQGQRSPLDVAQAILTTDKFPKLVWKTCSPGGKTVRILAMAKGSGMICPNMATMLGFVCCDAEVSPADLQEILEYSVEQSFNRISVDGDTSTNDCVLALANAASGERLDSERERGILQDCFKELLQELGYLIVLDAEGGTKVIRIQIDNAATAGQAESAARTMAHSMLVKTAIYGLDPNWGRIVAALGRSETDFDPEEISVYICEIALFQNGRPVQEDPDALLAPCLKRDEITIRIDLARGKESFELLTSDLSPEYVHINASYRS